MRERKPIFYDEDRLRWRRTRLALEITGACLTLVVLIFALSVFRQPNLPDLLLSERRASLHAIQEKAPPKSVPARKGRRRRVAALGTAPANYDPIQAAFYVPWDSTSMASLKHNFSHLDLLIPEALHAVLPDGELEIEKDPKLHEFLQTHRLPTMPLVNNYDGKVWRSSELAQILARPASRARLIQALFGYVVGGRHSGLVVDFEEIPERSQRDFHDFISELAAAFHRTPLKLMICLPAADHSFDYAYFGRVADAVILMNYDQHWQTSAPGPIAAQEWFQHNIEETAKLIPPEKLVMAIANYAYDWTEVAKGKVAPPALSVSFQQAIVTALESEATVAFDTATLNPHYSYSDERNRTHRVWMLDAVTAYNQVRASERAGVRGMALWRLGSEDPSLWATWDIVKPDAAARGRMTEIPPGYDMILEGEGDIWRIQAIPQSGRRMFRYDEATQAITDESFLAYPVSYRIDQIGRAAKKIVLTFDDGPDTRFTPTVLDILKEKKVPAAFFVTGVLATNNPALLRRIYDEGHEIGNHTYTHPHFADVSLAQLDIELNLTQRLLEGSLGIKTVLFRPPYGVDHQPESAEDVAQLPLVQKMGYLIVGSRIDPHDWGQPGGGPQPTASVIVERVLQQALEGRGDIVLLHDGGGERSGTVEALPQIIDRLRSEGFQFTSVAELLGQTRAQVMPLLHSSERWVARADNFIFQAVHWLRLGIAWVFMAGIALVTGRAIIIGILAIIEKVWERYEPPVDSPFRPAVSVLIPAFNEQEAIVRTVRAALASDYSELEVVVVNDGSVDRTGPLLDEHFENDPRVRIHHEPNRGKPAALNQALELARGEVVVTIDADTSIHPRAVAFLVRHFQNARVAAVAGNVKVGNRDRWLTRWQALEYITSQNMEKRAFTLLNCITVVPGAISAWRPSAIRECGGFPSETVAEDTDLTLAARRRGWRILYDDEALAYTQAPETAGALIQQRFRWTFGTLQAIWKHRGALFRYGTLGWVALPNIFLFQILLPLISPVIDLMFLGTLVLWGLAQFQFTHLPSFWTSADVQRSLVFFLAFMLIDLAACMVAFLLERHEDWSLLLPMLLQRFYYRQMMYWVILTSLLGAVQGHAVGWLGVERAAVTTRPLGVQSPAPVAKTPRS